MNKPLIAFVLFCPLVINGCSVTRYSSANDYAKPVIEAINEYKEEFGEYPHYKNILVPKYIDSEWRNNVHYRRDSKNGYRLDIYLKGNVECKYDTGRYKGCRWLGI